MTYTLFEFFTGDEIERDWLVSILSDFGFDGFEETSNSLKAYAPSAEVSEAKVREILSANDFQNIEFATQQLPDKNWNEEWEKNFEPVLVGNRVSIRAPFHQPVKAEYEIVIEPKMSFGTGHHATTAGMVELMLREDFTHKTVMDFGSGTGVLAILAEKLKAAEITAIDNEEWAYNNCLENIERNSCQHIRTIHGDDSYQFHQKFAIFLANINRNVILKNMEAWTALIEDKGLLMVSGILLSDEQDIELEAKRIGLVLKDKLKNNGWLAITFQKP